MKQDQILSNEYLTENIKSRYQIFFTTKGDIMFIMIHNATTVSVNTKSIISIESNGITVTFKCKKCIISIWINSVIFNVNVL